MAIYNKKLKTIEVHMMLDGSPVTIADTVDDDKATRALNEFKNYETASMELGGGIGFLPYHAVQYVKVTETDAEITKADPYYCEEETEGGN